MFYRETKIKDKSRASYGALYLDNRPSLNCSILRVTYHARYIRSRFNEHITERSRKESVNDLRGIIMI